MLRIISNGSKWAGESPDPIEVLYGRMEEHAIEPYWIEDGCESYAIDPETGDREPSSVVRFHGNFVTYSHVFCIDTDDVAVIERLRGLIRANLERFYGSVAEVRRQLEQREREREARNCAARRRY